MKPTPFLLHFLRVVEKHPRENTTVIASLVYEGNWKLKARKRQGHGQSEGLNLNYVVASYRSKLIKAGYLQERLDLRTRTWSYWLTAKGRKALKGGSRC